MLGDLQDFSRIFCCVYNYTKSSICVIQQCRILHKHIIHKFLFFGVHHKQRNEDFISQTAGYLTVFELC